MHISQAAVSAISGSKRIKTLLALEFDCTETTVRNWLRDNEDNSDLTKKSAVEIISKETGLTEEQILTEEKVN